MAAQPGRLAAARKPCRLRKRLENSSTTAGEPPAPAQRKGKGKERAGAGADAVEAGAGAGGPPFGRGDTVLAVGEGDFTWSACVSQTGANVTATSLDSVSDLKSCLPAARAALCVSAQTAQRARVRALLVVTALEKERATVRQTIGDQCFAPPGPKLLTVRKLCLGKTGAAKSLSRLNGHLGQNFAVLEKERWKRSCVGKRGSVTPTLHTTPNIGYANCSKSQPTQIADYRPKCCN